MVYRYPMRMLNVCTLWWLFGNLIIQKQSIVYLFYLQATGGLLYYLKESLYGLFIGVDHGYLLIIQCSSSIAACNSYFYLDSRNVWHQVQFKHQGMCTKFLSFSSYVFSMPSCKKYLA